MESTRVKDGGGGLLFETDGVRVVVVGWFPWWAGEGGVGLGGLVFGFGLKGWVGISFGFN